MRRSTCMLILIYVFSMELNAQSVSSPNGLPARYYAKIITVDGKEICGVLPRVTDSAVFIYSGSFADWKQEKIFPVTSERYDRIKEMYITRRNKVRFGVGLAIGAGLSLLPVALLATRSESQSGKQVNPANILIVPIGALVGGVVGLLTGRTFTINGDYAQYKKFKKKVKTYTRRD